jgi:two-component system, cell cycle sensor histidine kinase and response regulator CckA
VAESPKDPRADRPVGDVHDSELSYAELYRLFADNVQDLISLHDDTGTFCYASPSARALLGYDADELIGRSVYDFVVDEDQPVLLAAHTAIMKREGRQPAQYRAIRRDGTRIWCETTARVALHETTGEPWRIVAVTRDITERRALEQQMIQGQKMEALGRLAGGIAHDFNNVLTVVAGHAELLTARLTDDTIERAHAEYIREAAFRAAALTRQLLAFGRSRGRVREYSDLNATLLDIQPMLARVIGADVTLDLQLEQRLRAVRCEVAALEQIIVNLAVNARDAMPAGGRLTYATANTRLHPGDHASLPGGDYVQLTVTDTGTGMTPETAERVFEPFFTTKIGTGTGLGLSTVYSIMRQAHGDVGLTTTPGQGTTFTLLFPGYDEEITQTADGRQLAGAPLEGTETILVAEDDPGVRALVVAALERYGYRVMTAVDGMQALEMFGAYGHLVDLLITDVNMPELRGPEVVKRIEESGSTLPVLYISGFTSQSLSLTDTLQQRFLAKPFTPIELVQSVRNLLGRTD